MSYASPSQGLLTFGWEADLTVAGETIPIRDYRRFDNPWIQMDRGAPQVFMRSGPFVVLHDWVAGKRIVSRVE